MDDILKRPLFRNKARHYEQVKTGDIGKHAVGILAQIPRLYQAGRAGYQAYRSAQAARPAMGIGQQTMTRGGELLNVLDKPIVNVGLGGTGVVAGYQDIAQGIENRDSGQVALGIGETIGGARFGIRGLTQAGYPRAAGVSQYLQGTKAGQYTDPASLKGLPFYLGTAVAPLATETKAGQPITEVKKPDYIKGYPADAQPGYAGDPMGEASSTQLLGPPKDYVRIVMDKIEDYKQKTGRELTDAEKQQATTALTSAYQKNEQSGIQQKPVEEIVSLYSVQTQNPLLKGKVTNEANLPNPPSTNLNANEVADLAKDQENKSEAGKKLIENTSKGLTDDEKVRFEKYYDKFMNLSGGSSRATNLILMKLASGLLTGKTSQKGVRGFLEVLGGAGTEATDAALALYVKEQDTRAKLASKFMELEEERKGMVGGVPVNTETKRVIIPSQFGLGDYVTADLYTAKKGGGYAEGTELIKVPTKEGGFVMAPLNVTNFQTISPSTDKQQKAIAQMNGQSLGYSMSQQVLSMPDNLIGPNGRLKREYEEVIGTFESLGKALTGVDPTSVEADNYIRQQIISDIKDPDERAKALKTFDDRLAKLQDKGYVASLYSKGTAAGDKFGGIRPTDSELEILARGALIETRMQYIVANANKSEDRLTQKDIDNAKARTEIHPWVGSTKTIKKNYQSLLNELDGQFRQTINLYQSAGGNNEYVLTKYKNMPVVQEYYDKQRGVKKQDQSKQTISTLETIKLK
jgi:hypothetical protein